MKNWNSAGCGKPFIAAFSGGKDSMLAIYLAALRATPLSLIVMLSQDAHNSGAHGLPRAFFEAQAEAMGIPVTFGVSDWAGYEAVYAKLLREGVAQGAQMLVTGEIDVPEHRCWHERVTGSAGLGLAMPLWCRSHREVTDEFLALGFRTMIISVNPAKGMAATDLGRILTPDLVAELEERGIDPCGEAGEFHTAVLDGPLFRHPVSVVTGEVYPLESYLCLKIRPAGR